MCTWQLACYCITLHVAATGQLRVIQTTTNMLQAENEQLRYMHNNWVWLSTCQTVLQAGYGACTRTTCMLYHAGDCSHKTLACTPRNTMLSETT
jgi:hypothetical protein